MTETMTGGCQCGRVRYAVEADDRAVTLCHCRMCQRAVGGPFAVFKNVPRKALRWTGAEPDYFQSSPIARRGFCSACGTPLTFEFLEGSDGIELTLGSFDEPHLLRPNEEFAIESRHPFWAGHGDLPGMRSEENPSVTNRWMEKVGKLPD